LRTSISSKHGRSIGRKYRWSNGGEGGKDAIAGTLIRIPESRAYKGRCTHRSEYTLRHRISIPGETELLDILG
jgi:hypothetical protein